MRCGRVGDEMFDDKYADIVAGRAVNIFQNLDTFVVVPIMENEFHEINVGGRYRIEHVAANESAAVGKVAQSVLISTVEHPVHTLEFSRVTGYVVDNEQRVGALTHKKRPGIPGPVKICG